MRILISGATGFIGSALARDLLDAGHEVTALVRERSGSADRLDAKVERITHGAGAAALAQALAGVDGVVNLAGAPVLDKRWSKKRKRQLIESRVDQTRRLVAALAAADPRPGVLVSASAVGYYGDGGDRRLDEGQAPARDFLARLCADWEAAARAAEPLGLRVVLPRIGLVLGRGGGLLDTLLPLYRRGLGGPLGSGRQYMPWIHLADLLALIRWAIADESARGPYNATAPEPVTNRTFSHQLARSLGKPDLLRVPALALKLRLGEAASAVLGGQRATPDRLLEAGFRHRFPDLRAALADLLGGQP